MDIRQLPYKERIQARKHLRADNRLYPAAMVPMPFTPRENGPFAAWRSRDFLCQAHRDNGHVRLSINRTDIVLETGDWVEGITWEDLMEVKAQCGFRDEWAVEVYPPAGDVVNVANMRHLWLLQEQPAFGWKKEDA